MAPFSVSNIVVAGSNLAYVALAYWLVKRKFTLYAWILLFVAAVSSYFHLFPDSDSLLYFDIATAVLSSLVCFFHFLPYVKPSPIFVFTIALITTATLLWLQSGEDRECSKYIWFHSAWHVMTALSLYLLIKSTDLKSGNGAWNYPILTGGKQSI